MGWLIALGIIVLLAAVPLGGCVQYDDGGAVVKLILGPVRLTLLPRPKKQKKKPEKKSKSTPAPPKAPQTMQKEKPKEKSGGKLTDFLPLVRLGLDFLGDFRRKLRVKRLDFKLIMAAEDPCDLAVNYGRAWAAVGNLMPQLERIFVIKKRNIEVECDFTADEIRVYARLDLTITLGRLIALTAVYAVRAIKEYLNLRNKRKGGAVNEQKSS